VFLFAERHHRFATTDNLHLPLLNMSSSPALYPSYHAQAGPQPFDPYAPPAPPPKPSSQDVSRRSTPAAGPQGSFGTHEEEPSLQQGQARNVAHEQRIEDPGEQWLPKILKDKSKQELADILARPELLAALTHSTSTAHRSTTASQELLQAALAENISLASHLNEVEARLARLRSSTQTLLLSTHALERQWRQKQLEMDRALAPFSPSSLYQKLSQGVQEQEMFCRGLEESFLEADGEATEREVIDWAKRYRDAKKVYYSRQERKERWDEGRVGGWR